jgi:hypothetical protein
MAGRSLNQRPAPIGSVGLGNARGFDRAALDWYPTAVPIGRALVEAEPFAGGAWECACGDGALSKVLIAGGVDTLSTDIADRGFGQGGVDFLKQRRLRRPNVVTNPPFTHWQHFARHALELGAHKVALLGRLLLLEGWERAGFFQRSRLARVLVVGRANMRPPGTRDRGHSGMIAFAWFIWDRAARWAGGPVVRWIKPGPA